MINRAALFAKSNGARSFILFRAFRVPRLFSLDTSRIGPAIALLISLAGMIASYLVTDLVFERMPHIEDEVAYVWQARVIAHGELYIPTPPHAKSYLVPFVVDHVDNDHPAGIRFGKYPLGWPALLAVGVWLGLRSWVNPLLAGLGVWLTYRLGRRFFSEAVGLLAAGLTVVSPFFLMNSGSLLSHPFGLVLSAAFALAWLDLFDPARRSTLRNQKSTISNQQSTVPSSAATQSTPRNQKSTISNQQSTIPSSPVLQSKISNLKSTILVLVAGLSLGMLVLTRPYSAIAVAIPFGLHGLYLLVRGDWSVRRHVLAVGLIVLALGGLYFAWQKAVTGDAFLNPYLLWWPYDKIGFGKGFGILARGHNLPQAVYNTRQSLDSGWRDLFGWGGFSWIFLPFGLWAVTIELKPGGKSLARVNGRAWLLASVFASLVVLYMAYWIGSELFGPRYYYEGLFSLTLISAAGIAYLAGWRVNPRAGEKGIGDFRFQIEDWRTGDREEEGERAGGKGEGERAGASTGARGRKKTGDKGKRGRGNNRLEPILDSLSRLRLPAVMLLLGGLVIYNLVAYLPGRLEEMHGLYGANRGIITDLLNAKVSDVGVDASVGVGFEAPAGHSPALAEAGTIDRAGERAPITGVASGLAPTVSAPTTAPTPATGSVAAAEPAPTEASDEARSLRSLAQTPPTLETRAALPALVIVHSKTWHFYGALIELEDPFLTTPYVFAWSIQPAVDGTLHNDFPGRTVYHYYPDDPGVLYLQPKP